MNLGHAYQGVGMLEAQRRRSLTGARTVAISASRKIPEKRFCPRVRCRAVADAGSIGGVAGTHALAQTPAGSIGIAGCHFLTAATTHTLAACVNCQSRTLRVDWPTCAFRWAASAAGTAG
jgi:hypothetical protein